MSAQVATSRKCSGGPLPAGLTGVPVPSVVTRGDESCIRLEARDGLVWEKHLVAGCVDDGPLVTLGFYSVFPQSREAKATVLVCPGFNGQPRQVAGIEPPDFPDRAIGLRLAEQGFSVKVMDYCPAAAGADRCAAMANLAAQFAGQQHSAVTALAALTAHWFTKDAEVSGLRAAIVGHSLGAFVGAVTAGLCARVNRVVLASGAVPLDWLRENPHQASPLHTLPADMSAHQFADLLACNPHCRIQIQYGAADTVYGPDMLAQGAQMIAQSLGPRVEIKRLAMGHGTDAATAIAFLNEGARP